MKGSTHNHTLFCFRVVPISKTRNAHNIEVFIYFPILNMDEKIPSFMEQISIVNDEETDRIKVFDTFSREITTYIIVIAFVVVLCIITATTWRALYCLKIKQTLMEQRLLNLVRAKASQT